MSDHKALLLLVSLTSLAVAGCKDTQGPAWPGNAALTASGIGGRYLSISWPAATDNRQVDSYRVLGERQTAAKKELPGRSRVTGKVGAGETSFVVKELTDAAEYLFRVTAVDRAGNVSLPLKVSATTRDVTEPWWKDGAAMTFTRTDADGKTTLTFSWPAASDNLAVTRYRLNKTRRPAPSRGDYPEILIKGARSHTLTTDEPGGKWVLTAEDAAGNRSADRLEADIHPLSPVALQTRASVLIARMGALKQLNSRGRGGTKNLLGPPPDMISSGSGPGSGVGGLTTRSRIITGARVKLASGPARESRHLRRQMVLIKRCYVEALKKSPGLSGTLTVTLTSDKRGMVSVSSVTGMGDARFLACVKAAAARRGTLNMSGTVTLKLDPGKTSR